MKLVRWSGYMKVGITLASSSPSSSTPQSDFETHNGCRLLLLTSIFFKITITWNTIYSATFVTASTAWEEALRFVIPLIIVCGRVLSLWRRGFDAPVLFIEGSSERRRADPENGRLGYEHATSSGVAHHPRRQHYHHRRRSVARSRVRGVASTSPSTHRRVVIIIVVVVDSRSFAFDECCFIKAHRKSARVWRNSPFSMFTTSKLSGTLIHTYTRPLILTEDRVVVVSVHRTTTLSTASVDPSWAD